MADNTAGAVAILKEAIRRIDALALRPIWPKEAHYYSGVCKAGCITELQTMILEIEDNGEQIIGGSAYEDKKMTSSVVEDQVSETNECADHWWAIEGDKWICSLCGKSEHAQPPNVVDRLENALRRLIEHADAMEAQNQDYHQPEGPLRSQVLCEAMQALE